MKNTNTALADGIREVANPAERADMPKLQEHFNVWVDNWCIVQRDRMPTIALGAHAHGNFCAVAGFFMAVSLGHYNCAPVRELFTDAERELAGQFRELCQAKLNQVRAAPPSTYQKFWQVISTTENQEPPTNNGNEDAAF